MQEYIKDRCLSLAQYIIETNSTVRSAAIQFKVSKSTVHKDMVERLPAINKPLSSKVRDVLEINKAQRHIRGGKATQEKYRKNTEVCKATTK